MPSTNFEMICAAIDARKQMHAFYQGYFREMCPHCVGYKNGREKALFYQFAGDSSSGIVPVGDRLYGSTQNWRCVFVSDLEDLVAVDGPWHSARDHSRPQTCVDRIIAQSRWG